MILPYTVEQQPIDGKHPIWSEYHDKDVTEVDE
jgi:hypothetical protein